jgi:hypothetical protein
MVWRWDLIIGGMIIRGKVLGLEASSMIAPVTMSQDDDRHDDRLESTPAGRLFVTIFRIIFFYTYILTSHVHSSTSTAKSP